MSTQAQYRFRFRDSTGARIAELGYSQASSQEHAGVSWFRYYKHVYGTGLLEVMLNGSLPWLSDFDEGGQIDVGRRLPDEDWVNDFISINVGDWERTWPDGAEMFQYRGPGVLDILARSTIAWPAGTDLRSSFTHDPAESIMKNMVRYNVASDATTGNGRRLTFASPFTVTLATDQSRGNVVNWNCHQDILLNSLADLARVGGGDYSLTRDALDPLSFEFEFHPDQLGTDRSTTMIFSLALGNMANPKIRRHALGAKTVAIVGGPGQKENRAITVYQHSSYETWRHRELWINNTQAKTVDDREISAQSQLAKERPYVSFEWTALQTRQATYGKHYFLGDLISAVRPDTGAQTTHKILGVNVALKEDGTETVEIDTEEIQT